MVNGVFRYPERTRRIVKTVVRQKLEGQYLEVACLSPPVLERQTCSCILRMCKVPAPRQGRTPRTLADSNLARDDYGKSHLPEPRN